MSHFARATARAFLFWASVLSASITAWPGHHALVGRLPQFGDELLGEGDVVLGGEEFELEGVEVQALDLGEDLPGLDRLAGGDGHPAHPARQLCGHEPVVPPRGGDRGVGEHLLLDRDEVRRAAVSTSTAERASAVRSR